MLIKQYYVFLTNIFNEYYYVEVNMGMKSWKLVGDIPPPLFYLDTCYRGVYFPPLYTDTCKRGVYLKEFSKKLGWKIWHQIHPFSY